MQTKKKVSGRNSSREIASPRVSRAQRKVSENGQVAERKVAELITSSARKQKPAGNLLKKNGDPVPAIKLELDNTRSMVQEDTSTVCLVHTAISSASLGCKASNLETGHHSLETIFSPTFHASKAVGGEIANGVDFSKFFHSGDQHFDHYTDIVTRKTSESLIMEENHLTRTMDSSVNAMSPSNMKVDADLSSENMDIKNSDRQLPLSDAYAQNSNCDIDIGANLPSEVSAIYLAMKNSKLECVDEHGHDSISTDVYVEEDDTEEFDDFDPYLFIKNLPELSSVVPTFRPMLLPKQTRSCPPISLVLDLDETLVHSTLEPCDDADFTFAVNFNQMEHTVYVKCRPHLKDFMERVAGLFEVIVFTASQSIYAEQLLNVLDPKRRIFRHRVFRESCVFVDGNYLKDLSILGRDLARVVIIDNSPQAFGFQVDNGIPIESWFDDRSDQELLLLLPFLESLVGAEDVRPLIAEKFNLRERVASAF